MPTLTSTVETQYPSQEEVEQEVLRLLINHRGTLEVLVIVLEQWRTNHYLDWKDGDLWDRMEHLKQLLLTLHLCLSVRDWFLGGPHRLEIEVGQQWFAWPQEHKISMDLHNPSIISALHEFGHLMFGDSEVKAQAFAVYMFKIVFPRAFQKLVWDGHKLVRPAVRLR